MTFSGPAMVVGVFAFALIQRRRIKGSAGVESIHSESRPEGRSGTNAGLRYNSEIVTWLAIGCQIHLLTSNLVWYHYFVLSLPATLIVLRQAAVSAHRLEKCVIGFIVLWCLMLLGLEPIDRILFSPQAERMLRCAVANLILLIAVLGFGKKKISGAEYGIASGNRKDCGVIDVCRSFRPLC